MTTNREFMQQAKADADAQAKADWEEQQILESPETAEALWNGIFQRMTDERPDVHYVNEDRPGYDRRQFAVEGDLIEQARRDVDPAVRIGADSGRSGGPDAS